MSDNQVIPEAAVEAAARILLQTSVNRFVEPRGKALALCMAEVRPILEAAAPHMLAEVKAAAWEDAYGLGYADCRVGAGPTRPNPYRPTP